MAFSITVRDIFIPGHSNVVQSMVSFNHWLSSIKTNMVSTLVNANHASSNWAQMFINENSCSKLGCTVYLPLRTSSHEI